MEIEIYSDDVVYVASLDKCSKPSSDIELIIQELINQGSFDPKTQILLTKDSNGFYDLISPFFADKAEMEMDYKNVIDCIIQPLGGAISLNEAISEAKKINGLPSFHNSP